MKIEFHSVTEKPIKLKLLLIKMVTPSGITDYITGWYNGAPECYEWECNMEDTYYGGYLSAPYDVTEWAYL